MRIVLDFLMEPLNPHISSTNHEGRPLPRSELVYSNTLEYQPLRLTSSLPIRFRTSARDVGTLRDEGEMAKSELNDGPPTSKKYSKLPIISVPTRSSSQSVGASLHDRSSGASNLAQTNDAYTSSNSNNVRQIADRQIIGSRAFVSNDNMRSCYQSSQYAVKSMPRRNSPRNNSSSSFIAPSIFSFTTSPNNIENGESRIFTTPRWQLDSEVNACPICKSRFSFFLRKHHCRRCGRVVCDSCSPHRITIPFQYIVQPPSQGEDSLPQIRRIRQPDIENSSEYIGGGRQVRLCNPCVPDPNTSPPQISTDQYERNAETLHDSSIQTASTRTIGSPLSMESYIPPTDSPGAAAFNPFFHPTQQNGARNQSQTLRINDIPHRATYTRRRDRGLGLVNSSGRLRSNTVGLHGHANHYGNSSSLPSNNSTVQNSYSMSQPDYHWRLPTNPPSSSRPQISEEDECWICHEELPSCQLENFEALRAVHVSACIRHAIQLASGSYKDSNVQSSGGGNLPEQRTESIVNDSSDPTTMRVTFQHNGLNTNMNLKKERRTGVFPYKATEKDCSDDAECAICLEEFEIGVDMGRLECFCRFHLKCIRGWFKTRPGKCPIHQHNGGY